MRLITISATLGLLVFANMALGQSEHFFVKARLLDKSSKDPIPYASISVLGTNVGTACNDKGIFQLSLPATFRQKRIRVSCIGYNSKSFLLDSLAQINDPVLLLTADRRFLDEVTVASEKAEPTEILQEFLNSISRNYYGSPFNLELYSVISNYDTVADRRYQLETVLMGYYEGYTPGTHRKFKILQKRETGSDPLQSEEYTYWPSNELYSVDLITDQTARGIFNKDHWDKFEFGNLDVSMYDQDTVFVINYELPKPTTKITGYGIVPKFYRGTVYITHKSYAVVRHTLETSSFSFDIIYKKVDENYFPYLIKGDRLNTFKLDGRRRPFRNLNVIMVKDIQLVNPTRIDRFEEEWDPGKISYDKSYWDVNYPQR